jgi:Mrp family chromosome partitioning ATPase
MTDKRKNSIHSALALMQNAAGNTKQSANTGTGVGTGVNGHMGAVTLRANKKSGSVNILDRLREKNMLVHGSELSQEIKNEYRRIKRPLLSNAFGKTASLVDRGNMIMVTSSVPGEGKTYTATNLALALHRKWIIRYY